ncbi:4-nitrophenylphosphatase [Frieseomelitta varia]|uniref:4-nitrophenylphosphatase n=1 Tax=Frieseomelitta varia TaxID=561572 RepID=UPI001CB68BF9|nr:4-nitrophenylphosphatase [Frieseomelitta varia]
MNLLNASIQQTRKFLDSFDIILSDCDGVIWYPNTGIIPGTLDVFGKLQNLGKRLYLVTNNSTISAERYCKRVTTNGVTIKPEQIINTAKVISWYLKKIKFSDLALVIASSAFRQVLINDGFKVIPEERITIMNEDPHTAVRHIEDDPAIRAVIVDFSFSFDWAKMALSINCLKRKDVSYFCGCKDDWIMYKHKKKVIGSGPLIDVINRQSGRSPKEFAKPSENLKNYILDTCDVKDPSRCIFIGDKMNTDMQFAALCGFKKLFVGTGADTINDAKLESEHPDFYVPSLAMLQPLIDLLENESKIKRNLLRNN